MTEPDTSGRTESDDTEDEPEAARTWTAEEDSAGSEWTDRGDQAVDTDSGVVVGSVDLAEELGAPEAEAEAGVAVDPVNQGVDEPGAPAIEEGAPESGEPVDFVDLGGDESRAPAAGAESGVVADSGESGAGVGTSVADAEPSGSVGAGSTREGRAEAPTGDQVDDGEPAAADPVGTQPGSTDSDSDDSGSTVQRCGVRRHPTRRRFRRGRARRPRRVDALLTEGVCTCAWRPANSWRRPVAKGSNESRRGMEHGGTIRRVRPGAFRP